MRYFIKKEYMRKLTQYGFAKDCLGFWKWQGNEYLRVDKKTCEHVTCREEKTQTVMPFTNESVVAYTLHETNDEPKLPKHMWEAKE